MMNKVVIVGLTALFTAAVATDDVTRSNYSYRDRLGWSYRGVLIFRGHVLVGLSLSAEHWRQIEDRPWLRSHLYRPPFGATRGALDIPIWVLAMLLAAYPTIALIRCPLRRNRRRRRGLCVTCGYNLTGNESGVCPECGMTRCDADAEQPTA